MWNVSAQDYQLNVSRGMAALFLFHDKWPALCLLSVYTVRSQNVNEQVSMKWFVMAEMSQPLVTRSQSHRLIMSRNTAHLLIEYSENCSLLLTSHLKAVLKPSALPT